LLIYHWKSELCYKHDKCKFLLVFIISMYKMLYVFNSRYYNIFIDKHLLFDGLSRCSCNACISGPTGTMLTGTKHLKMMNITVTILMTLSMMRKKVTRIHRMYVHLFISTLMKYTTGSDIWCWNLIVFSNSNSVNVKFSPLGKRSLLFKTKTKNSYYRLIL
jgi:hypothetical protein